MDSSNTTAATFKVEGWSGGNPHHIRVKNAELKANTPSKGLIHVHLAALQAGIIGGNEFINLKVHGGGQSGVTAMYGFYVQSSDNLVDGCEIYDVAGAAIQNYNGYGQLADRNIYRNNYIHHITRGDQDNRVWGVAIYSTSSGTQVYNNVIDSLPGNGGPVRGIEIAGSSVLIGNNTVYTVAGEGVVIVKGSSNIVRNNISYNNRANYTDLGSGTSASNNMFSGPSPVFVNSAAGDFRLQPESPGIDQAATISAIPTDRSGTPRPQGSGYDIGAYELQAAQQTAPLPPTDIRIVVVN